MSTLARLAAFGMVLAAIFVGAFVLGGLAEPEAEVETHDEGHGGHPEGGTGFAVDLLDEHMTSGAARKLRFTILDETGRRVTAYTERHERDLHLIVVARGDLSDYQHLHPTLGSDGVWTVPLSVRAGTYRLYADTQPAGAEPAVLETDLHVEGDAAPPRPLPAATHVARVGPYAVSLRPKGDVVTLSVQRAGRPVTDLEPYLGASGHLVVLRAHDLAYLHAHPEAGPPGPDVAFQVGFTGDGAHALYFDFKHRGVVRTAMFRLDASAVGSETASPSDSPAEDEGDHHDH